MINLVLGYNMHKNYVMHQGNHLGLKNYTIHLWKISTSPLGRHLGIYKSFVTAFDDSRNEFIEKDDKGMTSQTKAMDILYIIQTLLHLSFTQVYQACVVVLWDGCDQRILAPARQSDGSRFFRYIRYPYFHVLCGRAYCLPPQTQAPQTVAWGTEA